MKIAIGALAGALLATAPALAQTYAVPMPVAPATAAMLRAGTEVSLRLSEELTTQGKQLRPGQRFHLEVAEPVIANGVTVVPVGTPAIGEVTDVRNKGMWGKSGHLSARILYLTVNGRQIRMSGTFDDKGATGTAGVVAAVAFVPIAGFFTTGTSARVPVGAGVKGFIDEDVPLAMVAAAPMPLAIGAQPVALPVAVPMAYPGSAPAPVATRMARR